MKASFWQTIPRWIVLDNSGPLNWGPKTWLWFLFSPPTLNPGLGLPLAIFYMAIFGVFFGQKISKTLKICCAGFIGFRGVTDPQVMFQLFVWDHFSPLLMSQTQVFAPRRYLLVLVCVHRVYPLVSSGCHRGPKGQKIDFSTLVWNCSGMVRMA